MRIRLVSHDLVFCAIVFFAQRGDAQISTREKWSFTTMGDIFSSAAIGEDGTIYFGSWDNHLYAVNPDGSKKWSYKTEQAVSSSPAIGDDKTVYVGSGDSHVYAISPEGTLQWKFKTDYPIHSSPAVANDGTIYIGSGENVYAIQHNGSLKWKLRTIDKVYFSPIIGPDGTIYAGTDYYGKLYAINPDGKTKWIFYTRTHSGAHINDSAAISRAGTIYFGCGDGYLYAINPDGSLNWSYNTGQNILSSPAIDIDGTIYIGSRNGYLYAINSVGTLKWSFRAWQEVDSKPSIDNKGNVYVGSFGGDIYALNPDGIPQWAFYTKGPILSSPTIADSGTIYVGSYDDKFYAIRNDFVELAKSVWPKFRHDLRNTGNGFNPNCPVAIVLGDSFTVKQGDTIVLDGSQSYDPDHEPLYYTWRCLIKPTENVDIQVSNEPIFAVTLSDTGIYRFGFTVTDSLDGASSRLVNVKARLATRVNIENETIPGIFVLKQNYPNPFNPFTTISYHVPFFNHVELKIYDRSGREVKTLLHSQQPAGYHSIGWNGKDNEGNEVSSGVYVYRLEVGSLVETRKMILLR